MVIATGNMKPDDKEATSGSTSSASNGSTSASEHGFDAKSWGYDLYPERRGEKYKPSWAKVIFGFEGTENIDKIKCERNVYSCVKNSPLVKLMMGALKSSGWSVRINVSKLYLV